MADDPIPCLLGDVVHSEHSWSPLVCDPSNPRVLHLGLADIVCPGWPR